MEQFRSTYRLGTFDVRVGEDWLVSYTNRLYGGPLTLSNSQADISCNPGPSF